MEIQCRYSICIASCFAIQSTKRKRFLVIQCRYSIQRFNVGIQYVLHHVLQFKVPKRNVFLMIQCRYSTCRFNEGIQHIDSMQVFSMYCIMFCNMYCIMFCNLEYQKVTYFKMIKCRSSIWRFNLGIQYALHHILQFREPKGNVSLT